MVSGIRHARDSITGISTTPQSGTQFLDRRYLIQMKRGCTGLYLIWLVCRAVVAALIRSRYWRHLRLIPSVCRYS